MVTGVSFIDFEEAPSDNHGASEEPLVVRELRQGYLILELIVI